MLWPIHFILGDFMKTRFVCKMPDARLVRNAIDRKEGRMREYIVERTIYLSK